MIKATLVAAASIFAAAPALAYSPVAYSILGHHGTVVERGSWEKDTITLSGPQGHTTIEVLCTGNGGNEWTSWGTTSSTFNQFVADDWCRFF